MPPTDMEIRTAKPGARIVKLSDGGGLQLWIMPDGAKRWRFAYRLARLQKVLAVGVYAATAQAGRAYPDKAILAEGLETARKSGYGVSQNASTTKSAPSPSFWTTTIPEPSNGGSRTRKAKFGQRGCCFQRQGDFSLILSFAGQKYPPDRQ